MVANLLVGGHDTTGSQIGCTLITLLGESTPGCLARRPVLAPSAVWETMRVEPSLTVIPRVSSAARGRWHRAAPGHLLPAVSPSANRDAGIWPDPDRFVVDRFVSADVPKPLSFGTGSHFCLGAHMARMTLEEVTIGLANHPLSR